MTFYTDFPSYPTSILNTTEYPDQVNDVDYVEDDLVNALRDEVIQIQTALGTLPAGPYADVKARLDLIDVNQVNIFLNSFRILMNGGLAIRGFQDGFADEFENETGTDAAETTAAYEAISDYYYNDGVVLLEQLVVTAPTAANPLGSQIPTDTPDVAQSFQLPADGSPTCVDVFIQKNGEPGNISFRIETDAAGAPSGTLAHANAYGTLLDASVSGAAAWYDIELAGASPLTGLTTYWLLFNVAVPPGPINNYVFKGMDGNPIASGAFYYRPSLGAWTAYVTPEPDDAAFIIHTSGPTNIVSEAVTADAAPDLALIVAWADLGTGSITYYASRNDGVNWTEITLTEIMTETGTIKAYQAQGDISAQPSDTNMRLKAVIAGDAKLHAWGLEWQ